MAVRVNNETFEAEVLRSDGVILADFYSDSCVPCKRLSPLLAEVEEEDSSDTKLVKININFDPELAEKYEVQSVPTLVFFRNGEEISRLNGSIKKSEILSAIENLNKE